MPGPQEGRMTLNDRDEPDSSGLEDERGGDAACWLRRVCQACGSLADADPPTTCQVCGAELTAD
jgi:rRNA maturation endonuclease Nob1